jgi:hypothetical protein
VKQPASPQISLPDLDQVVSAEGLILHAADDDVVRYRIEVTGDGFQVSPHSIALKLRHRQDSRPFEFQVISTKTGKRSLLINAYQEDDALAAQTRLSIEVKVAVQPA